MSSSETAIANGVLIKLGVSELLLSLDDDTTTALLIKNSYPKQRDILFRSHPWKFNKSYLTLAQVTKPAAVFDYQYAFQLPSDCARVFDTDSSDTVRWSEIENNMLVCDAETVMIIYGKIITDVDKFTADFVDVLELGIAADVAYALTQSTSQAAKLMQQYDMALSKARSFSAQVGNVRQSVTANRWVDARGRRRTW